MGVPFAETTLRIASIARIESYGQTIFTTHSTRPLQFDTRRCDPTWHFVLCP